jgi:hypothetical protein
MIANGIKEYQKIGYSTADSQIIDVSKVDVSAFVAKFFPLIYLFAFPKDGLRQNDGPGSGTGHHIPSVPA